MAMTLPISPPVKQGTTSDDSPSINNNSNNTAIPRTPVSPTIPQQQSQQQQQQQPSAQTPSQTQAQMKRKPSRRANTAERRANHNAVERQRRETLNGRFLDLAALLPNLSQIRRPSKSSIVNSSIAHIHASRRHRLLAARELRLLKLEADALRRELNEWRDRANIPRVEEPVRGDGFGIVIAGELEVIVGVGAGNGADEDEDDADDDMGLPGHTGIPQYGGYVGGDGVDEDFGIDTMDSATATGGNQGMMDDPRVVAMLKTHGNPFAHSVPPSLPQQQLVNMPATTHAGLPHILPRTGGPVFDGMYDGHPHSHANHGYSQAQYLHNQQQHAHQQRERELQHHHEQEKLAQAAAWGLFPNSRTSQQQQSQQQPASFTQSSQQHQQQQIMHAQRSLYTPPSTSHGLPSPPSTSSVGAAGSSSPGSSKRERSGSIASGYGSSPPMQHQHGSLSPSYELGLPAGVQGEYGVAMPRMVNVNVTGAQGMGMGGMSLMSPVSAGGAGGGGGGGFAMMM